MIRVRLARAGTAAGALTALLAASSLAAMDYRAAGEKAALPDFPALAKQCDRKFPPRDADRERPVLGPYALPPAMPTGKVFDNLVLLGTPRSSAWAISTSDGIILVDALTNDIEAALAERDMRAAGLDPKDIKVIVITHGHGDHYGGVNYFVERYAPRVIMGEADWRLLEDKSRRIDRGWGPEPRRGQGISREESITLGDTTVRVIPTPGHTAGTLSLIIPVKDGGITRYAALWGGTVMAFGTDAPRYLVYADSAARMRQLVMTMGIEIFLSNHVMYDNSHLKLQAVMATGGRINPFIMTPDRVAKAFEVLEACARGRAERSSGKGKESR